MGKLCIRTIRDADFEEYANLSHYAFGVQKDRELSLLRTYADPRRVLVAELDGQIVSQLFIHAVGLWVNGVCLPMGGIAGVTTVPEQQRRGYATQLLTAALQTMHSSLGYAVSMLFPAVYSLYQRLGWSVADYKYTYTAPPTAFQMASHLAPATPGRIERRQPNQDDIEKLQTIRHRYAPARNGFVERDRVAWELRLVDPMSVVKSRWLAFSYDEHDEPDGYILYNIDITSEGLRHLAVDELVAMTPAALYHLLTFLSHHTSLSSISLTLGADVPLGTLLANPLGVRVTVDLSGLAMLRIVDLERALISRPLLCDRSSGRLILQVEDPVAPWNNGSWVITLESGHATCEKTAAVSDPDALIHISVLGQLFVGYLSVADGLRAGLLHIRKPDAQSLLEALFDTRTPPYSGDRF